MVIYVDILLAVNLFVDFLLLCGVARVLHRPRRRGRLIGGAAVGALSALILLLPPLPLWLTLPLRVICAAVMVAVAFPYRSIGAFAQTTAVLFLISALFAGICEALWLFAAPTGLFVQSGVVYYDVPPLYLVGFTLLAYGGVCLYERLTVKRVVRHAAYRLTVEHHGQCVTLKAMLDTGCHLREPFSGAPVIPVNAARLAPLMTAPLATAAHAPPVRYIPFTALGGEGVLPSFRPDRVTVYLNDRAFDISGAWIAASDTLTRGEYDALIGPAAVDRLPLKPLAHERRS